MKLQIQLQKHSKLVSKKKQTNKNPKNFKLPIKKISTKIKRFLTPNGKNFKQNPKISKSTSKKSKPYKKNPKNFKLPTQKKFPQKLKNS